MFLTTRSDLLQSNPGDSGSGPAPSPAPAAPSSADVDVPAGPETTDFAAIAAEIESEASDLPAGPAAAPSPPPSAPPAQQQGPATPPTAAPAGAPPAAPAAAAQSTAPPAPAPAQAPPAAPAAAAPPPAAPAAEQQPLTPERIVEAYQAYEKNILPQLEKQYALSPEQAREIDENPASAIPKLMARVHYQAHVAAFTGIMSQLPQIVQMVMERGSEVSKAEEKFFSRWEPLRDPKHRSVVDNVLRSYRAANPNVSTEDMIEKAGLIAMISLGLDPTPQQQQQAPPVGPAPGMPPPRPAGVGGSGAPRPADRGAVNPFEALAEEMIAEGL